MLPQPPPQRRRRSRLRCSPPWLNPLPDSDQKLRPLPELLVLCAKVHRTLRSLAQNANGRGMKRVPEKFNERSEIFLRDRRLQDLFLSSLLPFEAIGSK